MGERAQSREALRRCARGTSSNVVKKVASVPPGAPPRRLAEQRLERSATCPRAFEARCTVASAGIESTPQEGTMIACVFVAR